MCAHREAVNVINDVVKRTLDAMEYIMKRENGDVLIVTHSAIIMALRCYIAGLPFDEMVRKFKTRNAEVVMIESFKIIDAIARFKKKINKSQQNVETVVQRDAKRRSLYSSFLCNISVKRRSCNFCTILNKHFVNDFDGK